MHARDIQSLPVGAKVRVVFEGVVEELPPSPYTPRAMRDFDRPRKKGVQIRPAMDSVYGAHRPLFIPTSALPVAKEIERVRPTFRPGDVVVVRHNGPNSTPYTYVRGANRWPGEYGADKSDAQMTTLFDEGKATLAMRDGKPYVEGSVLPF